MPILSDPTSVDSDGDGILDSLNNSLESKTEFADPNPLRYEFLWEWPTVDKDTGEKINRVVGGFIDSLGRKKPHGAIDITQGKNDVIIAAYDGEIVGIERNNDRTDKQSLGNYIYIKHQINGTVYYSRYGHLKTIREDLKAATVDENGNYIPGTYVYAGEEIAIMGGSGGYGVHLDFQIGEVNKPYDLISDIKPYHVDLGYVIDPVLFDTAYTTQNKETLKSFPLNMLMNIPVDIYNACKSKDTDGDGIGDTTCDDCYEYFEGENGIYKKYKIK